MYLFPTSSHLCVSRRCAAINIPHSSHSYTFELPHFHPSLEIDVNPFTSVLPVPTGDNGRRSSCTDVEECSEELSQRLGTDPSSGCEILSTVVDRRPSSGLALVGLGLDFGWKTGL